MKIGNLYFFISADIAIRESWNAPFPRGVFQTLAAQVEGHRRPLAGPFHAHEGPYVPPAMLPGRPLGCQLDPG